MTITSSSSSGTGAAASSAADWLSPDELRVLEAVCDTFFPSLEPPAGSSDVVKAYYQRKASDLNVAQLVAATLAQENAEAQADVHQLLGASASPVTGLMLAGRPKAFPDLSQQQREKYLQAMANSPVAA